METLTQLNAQQSSKETNVKMINMAQLNEAQPITESKASLSETKVKSEERKSEMG